MKAAASAQLRLLDLQAEDTIIAQLEHRKRSLPELAALASARVSRAKLGEGVVAARTRVADLTLEVTKAEADLVPVRERKERDQQRIDDGVVNDAKAINAMLEEIAHLEHRIGDLEDVALTAMEDLDAATAEEQRLAQELLELENSMRALIASRDEQVVVIDAELAEHQREREALIAVLPADLVALYDRIRVRAGGVGAAQLQGRRCGGCQLEATQADLNRYTGAAADDVVRCEECERILVRAS